MNIGLDFDGSLVHFRRSPVREGYKRACVRPYAPSFDYNFADVPENVRTHIFGLFRDVEYMMDVVVISGTRRKLKQWKNEGHTLTLITARSGVTEKPTEDFVRKNFPEIGRVLFVATGASKVQVFDTTSIDVWIDDNPKDTLEAAKMGIHTCLISNSHTRYNQHVKGSHMLHTYAQVADINL